MAETSFPIADGGNVSEDTYERLMAQVMGVGRSILTNGNGDPMASGAITPLVFADSTGRQTKVKANNAYTIRGFRWESGTEDIVVPLDANTSGKSRIDRIVLRLDRSTYTIRVGKVTGTPADTPSVPAVNRQLGSTGVYEVAIGRATVKSQTGTNLPSLAAADVVDESVLLAATAQVGSSTWMNSSLPPGSFYTQTDQQRIWAGAGGSSIIVGERGAWTKVAAAGGWINDNIYCQRVNGWTYLQCYITLSSTTTDKAPSTDLVIATLPPQFRPATGDFLTPCWLTPNQIGVAKLTGSTGVLTVNTYAQTFPKLGQLVLGPVAFPSNGVKA